MKHYSAERKAAVLQKMLPPTSLSVAELAKQEGISDVTLYHWRKQAMASGAMSAGPLEKIVSTIARTPHFVLVRKKKT